MPCVDSSAVACAVVMLPPYCRMSFGAMAASTIMTMAKMRIGRMEFRAICREQNTERYAVTLTIGLPADAFARSDE
jgi:hypothetical protein